MINVLIIDKEKNTVMVNLWDDEYKEIFKYKIDNSKIKAHKTIKELDKEVRDYLNLEMFKNKR